MLINTGSNSHKMKKFGAAIMAIAVVLIIIGGLFVFNSYVSNSNKTATVDMEVADLPVMNASAVYITFSAFALHGNNNTGWKNYSLPHGNETVNILGLTASNASLLTSVKLTAQTYTMFRLYITNVTVVIAGVAINFTLASSFGFLNHPVTLTAGSTSTIVFEFNLTQDLNLSSHIFTPNLGIEVIG